MRIDRFAFTAWKPSLALNSLSNRHSLARLLPLPAHHVLDQSRAPGELPRAANSQATRAVSPRQRSERDAEVAGTPRQRGGGRHRRKRAGNGGGSKGRWRRRVSERGRHVAERAGAAYAHGAGRAAPPRGRDLCIVAPARQGELFQRKKKRASRLPTTAFSQRRLYIDCLRGTIPNLNLFLIFLT